MPRPKGSKNRATIAAQTAFREQIIKEHEANRAAEKPPEAPPTPKEVESVTVQRETLDLGAADDKSNPSGSVASAAAESAETCETDDLEEETLDLEPPPPPQKKKPATLPPSNIKPQSTSLDKSSATRIVRPQQTASKPQTPPSAAQNPSRWRLGTRGT